jgi:hypothetical protein
MNSCFQTLFVLIGSLLKKQDGMVPSATISNRTIISFINGVEMFPISMGFNWYKFKLPLYAFIRNNGKNYNEVQIFKFHRKNTKFYTNRWL